MQRSAERTRFLSDILVTAVEGGSNYWARFDTFKEDGDILMSVYCNEMDEVVEPPEVLSRHEVTLDTIAHGVAKVLDKSFEVNPDLRKMIAGANVENDGGDIDADLADVILQAALFGELVYG